MARFVAFGEAMLRLAPQDAANRYGRGNPSAAAPMLFSIGGDELNVMVAAAKLGVESEWVSIVPSGPLGDVVAHCASDAGVSIVRVLRPASKDGGAQIGIFFVLPELHRVEYVRRASAFCEQTMASARFDWDTILRDSAGGRNVYVHATGITPMLGDGACGNWTKSMAAAERLGVPVVCDLNHRPQLGSLEELWSRVAPVLGAIKILVLSRGSLAGLAALFNVVVPPVPADECGDWATAHRAEVATLKLIHARIGGPAVVCCFKNRDAANVQRRWSVLVDGAGVHTTETLPIFHIAKDECGGGSAWACGIMHALASASEKDGSDAAARFSSGSTGLYRIEGIADVCAAMRRADLLAALCQEVVGDHSTVTLSQLEAAEQRWAGSVAVFDDARAF